MNNIINWLRAGPPVLEIWSFSSSARKGGKSLMFSSSGIEDAKQQIENWLQWPNFRWSHDEEDNHWVIVNVEGDTVEKNELKNLKHGYLRCVNDRLTDLSDINYEEWDPKAKEPSDKRKYKDWKEQRGMPWEQTPWGQPNRDTPYSNPWPNDPRSRYNGKWNPKEWEE